MSLIASAALPRRRLVQAAGAALAVVALPALADAGRSVAAMTEGPFYPPSRWREAQGTDWDADLTRVQQRGGATLSARGEALRLGLLVGDRSGRAVDGVEVEIWQCDALGVYRHPSTGRPPERFDAGFQGFGAARTDTAGQAVFRTIRPVPYAGRTPHIHLKLRHASFGELTSQLFVAGDPGNARDFLWRSLAGEDRAMLEMSLQPALPDSGVRWQVRQVLVLPA